jgi:xanthosine utilization system XapX-like protein
MRPPPLPPPSPAACEHADATLVKLTLDPGLYPADVRWQLLRVGSDAPPLVAFVGQASAGLLTGASQTERCVALLDPEGALSTLHPAGALLRPQQARAIHDGATPYGL